MQRSTWLNRPERGAPAAEFFTAASARPTGNMESSRSQGRGTSFAGVATDWFPRSRRTAAVNNDE